MINVEEPVTPSIQISADRTDICEGDSVHISSSTSNAGSDSSFTWQLNGIPVGTTGTYTVKNPSDGDQIVCLLKSVGCTTSPSTSSNALTISVNPFPKINLSPRDTIVSAGTAVTLNANGLAPALATFGLLQINFSHRSR
jgi:hypothetical protein